MNEFLRSPLPVAAALTTAAHIAWMVLRWEPPGQAEAYSNALFLLMSFAASLVCVQAWHKAAGTRRSGLAFLAGAMVLGSVGDSVWAYLAVYTTVSEFPSLADAFYLLQYPAFLLAFLYLAPLRRLLALRLVLDSLILGSAAATLLWWGVLSKLVETYAADRLSLTIALTYPFIDLALLLLLSLVLMTDQQRPLSLRLLIGGFAAMTLADLGFMHLESLGLYQPGHPVDALYNLGYLLLAGGAWVRQREALGSATGGGAGHHAWPATPVRFSGMAFGWSVLPALATLAVCLLLVVPAISPPPDVLTGIGITTLLLLAQQLVAFRDARKLTLDLQASHQRLAHQVLHDALTGLPNRAAFERRCAEQLGSPGGGGPCALVTIDLDSFKTINSLYGQVSGDRLLQQVGQRLRAELRSGDLLARPGGNEFLALIQLSSERHAEMVAQRLLGALQRPFLLQGEELQVSASLGVSLYPQDASEAGELRRCAEAALHRAKRGAGGLQFYALLPDAEARRQAAMLGALPAALERGEITLLFQPQFAVGEPRPVGAEALIRWHSPELGPVNPETFVSAAEQGGLIGLLGDWVLERACAQLAEWKGGGWTGRMAVNVSPAQLAVPGFAAQVAATLQRYGLRGEELELEITERAVLESVQESAAQLAQLSALGVRLAVDDFGMGHASLLYLLSAGIDVIKVDRHLVRLALDGEHEQRVLEGLVRFAGGLQLELIAEGVERPEQLALMERLGVGLVQGYLLGAPQTAAELTPQLQFDAAAAQPPERSGSLLLTDRTATASAEG